MSDSVLEIEDIRIETHDAARTVVAAVGGKELWFRFDGSPALGDVPSAILACCIYPAMVAGKRLRLNPKFNASDRLIRNLDLFQEIYLQWWPGLTRVAVEAQSRSRSFAAGSVGSMFSGGIDSFHTFLENEATIDTLIFAGGLDISEEEKARYSESVENFRRFADARGKRLITLWTNIKGFWPGVDMIPHDGQILASLGIMLGLDTTLIPASHTYAELAPWGSHPLTDPLIQTESTQTIHHGALPRHLKVKRVGEDEDCLAILRVCNASDQYNCGVCEKCLRTMTALRLLRLECPTLPKLEDVTPLRKLRLYNDRAHWFWHDNLELAYAQGDLAVASAVSKVVKGYELRRTVRKLLTLLTRR